MQQTERKTEIETETETERRKKQKEIIKANARRSWLDRQRGRRTRGVGLSVSRGVCNTETKYNLMRFSNSTNTARRSHHCAWICPMASYAHARSPIPIPHISSMARSGL